MAELQATLYRCRECPKAYVNKTNAAYHAHTHGPQDVIQHALLREQDAHKTPVSLQTIVHACSACSFCTITRSNAVHHVLRCGGKIERRSVQFGFVGTATNPRQPSTKHQACSEPAGASLPPLTDDDPLFAAIVLELSKDCLAAEWLTMRDDTGDDFDWVAVSAPVVWRTLRARVSGRLVEWTAADGRRLCSRAQEFRGQLLATCASACVAAAHRLAQECDDLQLRARVFDGYMRHPVDDWATSRLMCVFLWAHVSGEALEQAQEVASQRQEAMSQMPFFSSQAASLPLTQRVPDLCTESRRWITKWCLPLLCSAVNV